MTLSEMLTAVTEHRPAGHVNMTHYIISQPELHEMLAHLAAIASSQPTEQLMISTLNWLVDALLNYGIPSDLYLLPRAGEIGGWRE